MKRIIGILTAIMLLTQTVFAKDVSDYTQKFWDVSKDHWAFVYIADLAERGVINGYEDGSFKPNRTVTRAEWSKIMVDAAGVQVGDNAVYFTDMSNHWANKYVNAAKNYLTGYADGSYRPDQAATREDVTVAMVKLKGYDLSEVDYSYLTKFSDVESVSNYAKGYVAVAVQNNLISGFEDNTFRGQDTLTRAEAATLLYKAFQHGNADKIVGVPTEPIIAEPINPTSDAEQIGVNNVEQMQDNQENTDGEQAEKVTEEIKPYKIETLSKVELIGSDLNTQATMLKDVLYYIDGGNICSVNTLSGDKQDVFQSGDVLDFEGTEYIVDSFSNIFTDTYSERVLAYCWSCTQSDFSSTSEYSWLLINVSSQEVISNTVSKDFNDRIIYFVDESENFWVNSWYGGGGVYRSKAPRYAFQGDDDLRIQLNPYASSEIDGCMYFLTYDGIYEYDYSDLTRILSTDSPLIGMSHNGFYVLTNTPAFAHVNFDGKKDREILLDDIEIKDKKPMIDNVTCGHQRMFINSNEDIVIYDKVSSAFRKISLNR